MFRKNEKYTQNRFLKLSNQLQQGLSTSTNVAHHSCSSGEGINPADSLEEPSTRPCHQLLSSLLIIWIMSPVTNFSPASLQGIRLSFLGSQSNCALMNICKRRQRVPQEKHQWLESIYIKSPTVRKWEMSRNEARMVAETQTCAAWMFLTTYCCVWKRTQTDSFNKKVSSMKCQLLNHSCPSQSTDLLPSIRNGSVSLTRYSYKYGKVDKPFSRGQSSNINVFIIFKR